jgi:hypothetical protein
LLCEVKGPVSVIVGKDLETVELGSLCLEPSDELGVFGQACVDGDGEEDSEGKQVGCVKLKENILGLVSLC